ncbi:MipA/OmpV family protein [Pseudoalteromonas sp.]|uniref:MipA/OmpV family protein n=1 Tax=Pseudoalteromonas sp. TaxID=53249 RepID=UPI00356304CE
MLSLSASASAQSDNTVQPQIATEQLHLSINLGAGVITNPLKGGTNIPLVVVPQLAYYAQQWFFDNGRVGFSVKQTQQHNLNIVAELNPESRFFIDWHPSNLFALKNTSSSEAVYQASQDNSPLISIKTTHKRKLALDAGISYSYVLQQQLFSIQALQDMSGVYNGWRAALQWQYYAHFDKLTLKPTLGVNYKSAQLNDYFYGLHGNESPLGEIVVGSSWQPYAKIDARWRLSAANAVRFHVAYYDYSAVDSSPLFERHYSTTAFIGFEHTF